MAREFPPFEIAYHDSLPIYARRQEILRTIRSHQVVIVAGETGSGKTTHLPLLCLEAGRGRAGRIVCTQPRRIAAITLATYVAKLVPSAPPGTVAYKVRFRQNVDPATRITFVTDGILLAESTGDPLLSRYDTIIIDEAHERTLNIDFLLGYLRTLLLKRPDLKLIICSATIDTRLFSRALGHAPVITVSGRLFPVQVRYEPVIALWNGTAMRSHVDGVIHTIRTIIDSGEPGDILAFLPTVDDIQETVAGLRGLLAGTDNTVLPLYGRMHPEEQELIFEQGQLRRIVVATNIAETSVTVPGIRFVVDTGLARIVRFDPAAGINRMPVERISRAAAQQRAGRCGRVREGVCIRLYSEQDYESRPQYSSPEIRRSNLSGVILRMARLGMGKPERFPFLQRPAPAALAAGYRQLRDLCALDRTGKVTPLGRAMAALPLDPAIARMIIYSRENGSFREVVAIAAALSVGDLRSVNGGSASKRPPNGVSDPDSDFMGLIRLWERLPRLKASRKILEEYCDRHALSRQHVREWIDVHRQVLRVCRRLGTPALRTEKASYEAVHKSLLSALSGNIAQRQSEGSYRTARLGEIMVSPGSSLFRRHHPWVLFHDLVETTRPYGRSAAMIRPHWVEELFPARCRVSYEDPWFDPESGTVIALRRVTFEGLHLVENQRVDYGSACPEEAHRIFIQEALVKERIAGGYAFLHANRTVRDAIDLSERKLRTRSLYRGDDSLADFYEERLPGVTSAAQLNRSIAHAGSDRFLFAREEDLLTGPLPEELGAYPDHLTIGEVRVPVSYVFDPDSESDGATVAVPFTVFCAVPPFYWEWLLPVWWRGRLERLVSSITGEPGGSGTTAVVDAALEALTPLPEPFLPAARRALDGGNFRSDGIPPTVIAAHWWLRIAVVDNDGVVANLLRPPLSGLPRSPSANGLRPRFWAGVCGVWEKEGIVEWDFGRALEVVRIAAPGQTVPLWGMTGLAVEGDRICLRVFFSKSAAYASHRQGVRALIERRLAEDLAWTLRDIAIPDHLLYRTRKVMEKGRLEETIERLVREEVLDMSGEVPADSDGFAAHVNAAASRIPQAVAPALALAVEIIDEYATCARRLEKATAAASARPDLIMELTHDLAAYFARLTSSAAPLAYVRRLPRYLRAFALRLETAIVKPQRYRVCREEVREFADSERSLRREPEAALPGIPRALDELEDMIEEYTIHLFAPGGVAARYPVSRQRIVMKITELQEIMKNLPHSGGGE